MVPEKIANVPEVVAIACGWYHCMLLDVDGSVWVFGKNDHLQLVWKEKSYKQSLRNSRICPKYNKYVVAGTTQLLLIVNATCGFVGILKKTWD